MGFRFHNLNPIYRICLSKLSPNTSNYYHRISLLQASNFLLLQDPCLNSIYNIPRRWHLGHSHHGGLEDRRSVSGKESEKIFRLGLASDVVLAVGKALTGYVSGSTAIIADAAHSVSDVVFFIVPNCYCLLMLCHCCPNREKNVFFAYVRFWRAENNDQYVLECSSFSTKGRNSSWFG